MGEAGMVGVVAVSFATVAMRLTAHLPGPRRTRPAAAHPRRTGPVAAPRVSPPLGGFYSTDFSAGAPTASRKYRFRLTRRVDAAFFDAVTRHPRDAVRFQFRPVDPAARIGIGAARMKRAA